MTPRRSPPPQRWRPTPSVLVFGLIFLHGPTDAPLPSTSLPTALPGMSEPAKRSLLVTYYEALLDDEDVEGFRRRVRSRYSESTLGRLCRGGDVTARRAAVVAIGLIGTMESNAAVAAGLADEDPAVRELSERALWSIWFRADSPENNAALDQIAQQIGRGHTGAAIGLSTTLIEKAPEFAEAYNQRAIALFADGRFADSAADCRKVLELNPYHIGALGGLAQCYMRMGDRGRALATYRRASELQPYDLGLRQLIRVMESGGS